MKQKYNWILISSFFAFVFPAAAYDAASLKTLAYTGLEARAAAVLAPEAPAAVEAASLVVEPDMGKEPVLSIINGAERSINITIYELDDAAIVDALINASKSGKKVRVLYNYYSFHRNDDVSSSVRSPDFSEFSDEPLVERGQKFEPDAVMQKLADAGVAVQKANEKFTHTHQKTITADAKKSIIMTFNLRSNYFKNTRDFGYVTADPAQVAEIEKVFEADWNYTAVSPYESALVWSPDNSRSRIEEIINSATTTLDLYQQEALDKQTIAALAAKAKSGVKVRLITAKLKNSSGGDANEAGRQQIISAGGQAKVARKYYCHAKTILADYGLDGQRAFIGSENFSRTSLDRNRELGVIFSRQDMLATLNSTFEQDWSVAK